MFKINKKIILAVLLGLVAVSIGFVVYKLRTSGPQTPVGEEFQQPINIPNYFQGSALSIENDIKKMNFNFPSELSYLEESDPKILDATASATIATNLGFTSNPIEANDIQNGTVFIWNGNKYSLIITPKINLVQLSSNDTVRTIVQNTVNKQIDDNDYKSLGISFLVSKIGVDPQKIYFTGFNYYKIANGVENLIKVTKDQADVVQSNYSENSSTYPVLTVNPDEPQIYIQFSKDGAVTSFKGEIGLNFQESLNKYPILNFDQFSQKISQSIIVSLNDNNINLPDLKISDLSSIKAEKVSLAYLLDNSNTNIIQPVFLINGTAVVSKAGGQVNILMYLPAFQSQNQP